MSILIKGMEMPKEGEVVTVVISKGRADELIPDLFGMRYGCMSHVVEVPTPHGRLIDADELKANIHMEGYRGYRARYDGAVTTFNYINNAPTIIEAEE